MTQAQVLEIGIDVGKPAKVHLIAVCPVCKVEAETVIAACGFKLHLRTEKWETRMGDRCPKCVEKLLKQGMPRNCFGCGRSK